MNIFIYKMYIRTKQGQEFIVGQKEIKALNVDLANSLINKIELPFHHFSTIQIKH